MLIADKGKGSESAQLINISATSQPQNHKGLHLPKAECSVCLVCLWVNIPRNFSLHVPFFFPPVGRLHLVGKLITPVADTAIGHSIPFFLSSLVSSPHSFRVAMTHRNPCFLHLPYISSQRAIKGSIYVPQQANGDVPWELVLGVGISGHSNGSLP